jgi:type I restriction enzyme S subunit
MKKVAARPLREFALGFYDGPHATPPESTHGPIFLRIDNITPAGRLDLSDLRFISEQDFPRWTRRVQPQEGDVVFSYEAALHRYAVIPEGFHGCLGRRLALLRPNRGKVEPAFLLYYFLSDNWRRIAASAVINGATVDRLSLKQVPTLMVRIPEPSVQRQIVQVLCAYDDLIENNARRIALLEQAARLLYEEWFVRLRFPGYEHVALANGLPTGWRSVNLGEYVNCGGVEFQTGPFGTQLRASDYTETGTPVINVRNIGYGDLRAEKLEFVPEMVVQRLEKHALKTGDVVFGRKGAVDRHVLISPSQDGWLQGSDCIRLRVLSDEICPVFLSFSFRRETHRGWLLAQCGNKATMASLNQDVLGRIPLVVPSRTLIRQFHEFASTVLAQIGTLQRQSRKLAESRDLLLPRLMSGEVAV